MRGKLVQCFSTNEIGYLSELVKVEFERMPSHFGYNRQLT